MQSEIKNRLEAIDESSKQLNGFNKSKTLVSEITIERNRRLDALFIDPKINEEANKQINVDLEKLKAKIICLYSASTLKVTSGDKIPESEKVKLTIEDFEFQIEISARILKLKELLKNNIAILYNVISASKDAFLNIKKIEKQKQVLENQLQIPVILTTQFQFKVST